MGCASDVDCENGHELLENFRLLYDDDGHEDELEDLEKFDELDDLEKFQ